MAKLDYHVTVDSGDPETDNAFVEQMLLVFDEIVELHKWGYTDDEVTGRAHYQKSV